MGTEEREADSGKETRAARPLSPWKKKLLTASLVVALIGVGWQTAIALSGRGREPAPAPQGEVRVDAPRARCRARH